MPCEIENSETDSAAVYHRTDFPMCKELIGRSSCVRMKNISLDAGEIEHFWEDLEALWFSLDPPSTISIVLVLVLTRTIRDTNTAYEEAESRSRACDYVSRISSFRDLQHQVPSGLIISPHIMEISTFRVARSKWDHVATLKTYLCWGGVSHV